MNTRTQAIAFCKKGNIFHTQPTQVPPEWSDLVATAHGYHWNRDDEVCTSEDDALALALVDLYPTPFRPQRPGSEGCTKCGGTGISHTQGGQCFACA